MTEAMARTSLLVHPILVSSSPTCFITTNLNFSTKNLVNLSHLLASVVGDTSHRWYGRVQLRLAAPLSTAPVKVFKKLVLPQFSMFATMVLQVSLFKTSNQPTNRSDLIRILGNFQGQYAENVSPPLGNEFYSV